MKYDVGDIVRTKKQHPCGSKKCQGCEHIVTLPREKALKAITKIEKKVEN